MFGVYDLSSPVLARGGQIESELWLTAVCPKRECGRPFFAVYERPEPLTAYAVDFRLNRLTPYAPFDVARDDNLKSISPQFYEILDQANHAEHYRLHLLAGMGYRKALEFLAKDYVVAGQRRELAAARESGDLARAQVLSDEINSITAKHLVEVIRKIPHSLTQQAAERAAWLGNDETHYTRVWTKHDVGDLKTLLGIVMTFISHEATAEKLVADMTRGAAPG